MTVILTLGKERARSSRSQATVQGDSSVSEVPVIQMLGPELGLGTYIFKKPGLVISTFSAGQRLKGIN